ncbi:hypothetical protein IW148_000724 [Coemansia sp. RSA 1199]|nr:hypothetical protein IW148_000724 [Coemansia sp. RSA 1199]
MYPDRHIKAFIMLNKCLVNADYQCIQALLQQRSWVYGHMPMVTQILVHHILKEPYSPVMDKQPAVSTKKPAAFDDEPAVSVVEQYRFTDEEYWAKVVNLQLRVFKDYSQHTFNQFILTDGVSLCVVCQTVEATLAKKAAGEKRKRNRLAQQAQQMQPVQLPVQLQHEQLAAQQARPPTGPLTQQAWMSTGPPVRLPMVIPAQQVWMSTGPLVQQARLPTGPPTVPLGQPTDQPAQPVQWRKQKADCKYIHELSQEQLQNTVGRCVLVNPSQQDLLFAMCEDSSIAEKKVYRYTRNQQRVETKQTKYKKIFQQVKTAEVAAAERTLSAGSYLKPDLDSYKVYLAARADVAAKLTWFYNHTMSRQRDDATTPEVPIHRKLRLSGYIKRQQADQRLVKRLRAKFKPKESDSEPVFIMGNWSAPMAKFHEPIQGKGWRTLLKRGGFDIYLIDEHLTSKTCPNCFGRLSNTHDVPNPRPWMRTKHPMVKCHGLLSCTSEACLKFFDTYDHKRGYLGKKKGEKEGKKKDEVIQRLWNRDLVGVLNFRHILFSLREKGTVPTRFQRGQPTEAPKTRKTRKAPTNPT